MKGAGVEVAVVVAVGVTAGGWEAVVLASA